MGIRSGAGPVRFSSPDERVPFVNMNKLPALLEEQLREAGVRPEATIDNVTCVSDLAKDMPGIVGLTADGVPFSLTISFTQ